MKPIFEFDSYKEYVNQWISHQPNKGRGLLSEIARELNIHTTALSHTLRGEKNLTCEQAILLAEYIGLPELEADFFLLLLQIDRAGNFKLKQKYQRDLRKIQTQSQQISKRIQSHADLTDQQKAQFYSSWIYSGLRQLSSVPDFQKIAELGRALPIKKEEFNRAVQFLLETGLCIEKGNSIGIGPANTHISADSPFVFQHHKNWRIKAMEKHNNLLPQDLMYTAPFTISHKDFGVLREETIKLIQKLITTADKTSPEQLACLNIDLFVVK